MVECSGIDGWMDDVDKGILLEKRSIKWGKVSVGEVKTKNRVNSRWVHTIKS